HASLERLRSETKEMFVEERMAADSERVKVDLDFISSLMMSVEDEECERESALEEEIALERSEWCLSKVRQQQEHTLKDPGYVN
ncbi:hypothetical protein BGZ52_008023, partial [Haplosporangium bisporale]